MSRSAVIVTLATLTVTFAATPRARADARPAFTMMDNTGDGSELDLAFPIGVGRGEPHQTYRPRLLVQDFTTQGFGGYAALQGTAVFDGGSDSGDHGFSIGNLEH